MATALADVILTALLQPVWDLKDARNKIIRGIVKLEKYHHSQIAVAQVQDTLQDLTLLAHVRPAIQLHIQLKAAVLKPNKPVQQVKFQL